MTDSIDESLYGLIEIAERQQAVAQTVLEGMANERAALETELERLAEHIAHLQSEVSATVSNAISEAMISAEEAGIAAATGATDSLRDKLDGVGVQAEEAEKILRTWVQWLSWRLLTLGVAGVAALAVLWWLASCAVLWWDTSAIGSAQAKKAQLQVEIAQLQANHAGWVKAGVVDKLTHCGPKKQPCVRVDESAGSFGEDRDYRLIKAH